GRRKVRMTGERARVLDATAVPGVHEARQRDHAATRRQAAELTRRWNRPLSQQPAQEHEVTRAIRSAGTKAGRGVAAAFELAQLILQQEREIERHQKKLRAIDRAALVRRERREAVTDGHE